MNQPQPISKRSVLIKQDLVTSQGSHTEQRSEERRVGKECVP